MVARSSLGRTLGNLMVPKARAGN